VDELYVLARRVLLDALEALGDHRAALVLVGAQAVYLRVGEADLAVAPYTTDGDLAVDPAHLTEVPPIERVLTDAGFAPKSKDSVGVWIAKRASSMNPETEIAIDLLVPASVSPGKGRRDAKLPGHAARTARIVEGLEGAVVDHDAMTVTALGDDDDRAFEVRVAGSAALLLAKVFKIRDRRDGARESDKDALDVLRLLRGTQTADLAARYRRLLDDERSSAIAMAGRALFAEQFGTRAGIGVEMATRASAPLVDAAEIAASAEALADDLLRALSG